MTYFLKLLQLREINLLRESNVQLREENKYNFEECQVYRYFDYLFRYGFPFFVVISL